MKKIGRAMVLVAASIALNNCDNSLLGTDKQTYIEESDGTTELVTVPYTDQEIEGLIFMIEEEKMARDTYTVFGVTFGSKVFNNIKGSEQQHMDAIATLLSTYQIPLPETVDQIGVFENDDLQNLYNALTDTGSASLSEALKTGAIIEEVDIVDLSKELEEVVENEEVKVVFQNLIKGSENHLRAFVKNLNSLGITYTPSFLSQEEYDRIINA